MYTKIEGNRNDGIFGVSYYNWTTSMSIDETSKISNFKIAVENFKLFCKYSTLVGFKHIGSNRSGWIVRIYWILLHVIALSIVFFIVYNTYQQFVQAPFVTTVQAEYYPTHKLDFPGVAICAMNRISRRLATEMANEIFRANITDFNMKQVFKMMFQIGDLYDSATLVDEEYDTVDNVLSKFYDNDYDISDVLKHLTPECSTMLLACYFHGRKKNCSEIFTLRKTVNGFCCTFNYVPTLDKESRGTGKSAKIHKVNDFGVYNGLSVLMDPVADDYFYSIHPVVGWKVMLFNPGDYPDVTSGGSVEVLVPPRTERYVEVDALMLESTKDIMSHPVSKRRCVFPEELTARENFKTYSDCIVQCKIADALESCDCVPFFFPTQESKRTCSVQDIKCLAIYKSKWETVVPFEDELNDAISNKSWALRCKKCYPSCSDVTYIVKTSMSFINSKARNITFFKNVRAKDHSTLHIYFNNLGTTALEQDLIYRWYEFLSDIGGICGIFIGFSIISLAEIFFFFVHGLVQLCLGSNSLSESENSEIPNKLRPIQTIYWSELFPRSRIDVKSQDLHRRSEN